MIPVIWDEPMESMKHLVLFLQSSMLNFMKWGRSKARGLCCGAGGASDVLKKPRKATKRDQYRAHRRSLGTQTPISLPLVVPFCNTMMTDGVKNKEQEASVSRVKRHRRINRGSTRSLSMLRSFDELPDHSRVWDIYVRPDLSA